MTVAPDVPSGRQVELVHDRQRATVVEVGAGLRCYTVGGSPVVDGYRVDELCPGSAGQLLLPWPNRLAGGTYEFAGQRYQLALSEPARANAIHGLVQWVSWRVADQSPTAAAFEYRLAAQPGYPFTLELRVEYSLSAAGLAVRTSATNVSDRPCPFGAGAHPYIATGPSGVDGLELCCPAGTFYVADDRGIPQDRRDVAGSDHDFRRSRPLDGIVLDTAFTDLRRDASGRATIDVVDRATGRRTAVWLDGSFGYVMLYTADTLSDRDRRRRGLAVEPMTCAPDAFNSGDGLRTLAPCETFVGTWGIDSRDG